MRPWTLTAGMRVLIWRYGVPVSGGIVTVCETRVRIGKGPRLRIENLYADEFCITPANP